MVRIAHTNGQFENYNLFKGVVDNIAVADPDVEIDSIEDLDEGDDLLVKGFLFRTFDIGTIY